MGKHHLNTSTAKHRVERGAASPTEIIAGMLEYPITITHSDESADPRHRYAPGKLSPRHFIIMEAIRDRSAQPGEVIPKKHLQDTFTDQRFAVQSLGWGFNQLVTDNGEISGSFYTVLPKRERPSIVQLEKRFAGLCMQDVSVQPYERNGSLRVVYDGNFHPHFLDVADALGTFALTDHINPLQ